MAEESPISEAELIAAQLRAAIRMTAVARGRAGEPISTEADAPLEAELMTLQANCEIAHTPFRSHRRFLGRFIVFIRNLAREMIVQPLEKQDSYNRAGLRALERLNRRLDAIVREQELIRRRLDALEAGASLDTAPGRAQAGSPNGARPDAMRQGIEPPESGISSRGVTERR